MDRLLKKWETAKNIVPSPIVNQKKELTENALLFFGTTNYAAVEAIDLLAKEGIQVDSLRIVAFPFNNEVLDFIDQHEKVFVIEQNRDAQMKTLLMKELEIAQHKLISVLNYNGIPITADAIKREVSSHLALNNA